MRIKAMVVVVAMVAAGPPTTAETDDCDNEAYFERLLTTAAEGNPDSNPDGQQPPPTAELQRSLDALVARTMGLCMEDIVASAEDNGGLPITGDHLLIFELNFFWPNLRCANGDGVGPNGHSNHAESLPKEMAGEMPWSHGGPEYVGFAYSDFSTEREHVYYIEAYIYDMDTGKSIVHDEPIEYAGISDFWCESENVWDWRFLINMPWLSGTVGPAVARGALDAPSTPCLPTAQVHDYHIGGYCVP